MSLRAQAHDILLNHDFHTCPQHESLALHENYATQWKGLHNGLMVNKSPNPKKKKMLVSQIHDNFDIDEKYLRGYVKYGS